MILLEMDAEARLWFFVSAGSEWVAGLEPAKRLMAAKGVANVAVFASTTTDWEFRPMPSAMTVGTARTAPTAPTSARA